MPKTAYRNDIDGLRALAVLSVVIFHIQESWLPGGFVGVDIFFVLSGYLISQQLFPQIQQGTFSLRTFYVRRIRRIVPAMLVVIFFTVLASQWLFRPQEAEATARSGLWAVMSLANVYFWLFQDTGYFAESSLELPLLHLWSLGVEEQFYVFWPLFLMAIGSFVLHRSVGMILIGLILASTALAQWTYPLSHSFTYYMLPTRAGELLVGALMAYWVVKYPKSSFVQQWAQPIQITGLAMIIASLALFDHYTVFPGWSALLPTVGVGMMLLGGHYATTRLSGFLAISPLRFFGLISYSLYLWHWPVLAFYRYGQFTIDLPAALILFGVITALGYLSYRYVETPFRHASEDLMPMFVKFYALPGALIAIGCLTSMKLDGLTFRALSDTYQSRLHDAKNVMRPAFEKAYVCQSNTFDEKEFHDPACVLGERTEAKTLLMGDSNAAHYIGVWGALSQHEGGTFRNVAIGTCPPVAFNLEQYAIPTRRAECLKGIPVMYELAKTMETVIISSSWTFYVDVHDTFIQDLKRSIKLLTDKNINVVLFGKAAVFKNYNRRCKEKELSFPFMDCTVDDHDVSSDVANVNAKLKSLADSMDNVIYTDINDLICKEERCRIYNEKGELLYYDSSHISVDGSWFLGEKWVEALPPDSPLRKLASQ